MLYYYMLNVILLYDHFDIIWIWWKQFIWIWWNYLLTFFFFFNFLRRESFKSKKMKTRKKRSYALVIKLGEISKQNWSVVGSHVPGICRRRKECRMYSMISYLRICGKHLWRSIVQMILRFVCININDHAGY